MPTWAACWSRREKRRSDHTPDRSHPIAAQVTDANSISVSLWSKPHALKEALPHFVTAAERAPARADIHDAFGWALATNRQMAAAISHYRTPLELNPNFAAAHFHLGEAFRQAGQLSEAAKHFAEAERLGWRD
jgi:tetratricopeptide (TPR) repeat protein